MFEVRQESTLSLGDRAMVVLDHVALNKGGAYANGIFTAPVAGTYIFWATITAIGNSHFEIDLMMDGGLLAKGFSGYASDGTASIIYAVTVNAGQRLWYVNSQREDSATQLDGGYYSNFGGALLSVG